MQSRDLQKTAAPSSRANANQNDNKAGLRLPAVPIALKVDPRAKVEAGMSIGGSAVVQRVSAFSKHVIMEIIPGAALEMGMVDGKAVALVLAAPKFLQDEITDNNDFSEAFNAFMHIYNGLIEGNAEGYLMVAEAFKKTVYERLMALEQTNTFPKLPIRSLVLQIRQATAAYDVLVPLAALKNAGAGHKEGGSSGDSSDSGDSGSISDISGEEEEKEHHWTHSKVTAMLKSSTNLSPLSPGVIKSLEKWVTLNPESLKRAQTKILWELLKKANQDVDAYTEITTSKRPKTRKKRKSKKNKTPQSPTFAAASGSEESESELHPDVRLKKHPVPMASVSGRSHVYGLEDDAGFRYLVTGLPYADTYLALFKDGVLVPRNINSVRNRKGRRKRMGEVAKKIAPALEKRDILFAELDKLNLGIDKLVGEELGLRIIARDAKFKELHEFLAEKIRPHVESIVFGSSIAPTNEDILATEAASAERSEVRKALAAEKTPSVASELITTLPGGTLTTGRDTETHAEQSLINTETWQGLIKKLVKAIKANKDHPEQISQSSFTILQMVLNRSTCIGCARELTAELISFWIKVAEATASKSWREAKTRYEQQIRFMVDFPAIYESSEEARLDNANLIRIILGLKDAGWQVRVTTGIKASASSNESNAEAQKLVEKVTATPAFFAGDWDFSIRQFPIPKVLAAVVEASPVILVNGVRYRLTEDKKSLTRSEGRGKDSIDVETANRFHFQPTSVVKK